MRRLARQATARNAPIHGTPIIRRAISKGYSPTPKAPRYFVSTARSVSAFRQHRPAASLQTAAYSKADVLFDSDDWEWPEGSHFDDGTVNLSTAVAAVTMSGSAVSKSPARGTTHHAQSDTSSGSGKHAELDQQQQQQTAIWPANGPVNLWSEPAGSGFVGLFVAGWMAVIRLTLKLLQPLVSLLLMLAQPLTHMSPAKARRQLEKWVAELPEGFWAKLHWVWERPLVKSIRITATFANWGVRLPAVAALLLTQGGALASQVSLPMLAPLLLGTGMMMNSIKANASFIIPRLGLLVVLLWVLWFVNSVIQTTWLVLKNQGRIDARTMSGARMATEVCSLLLAGIVALSMLGINISALLLPTGVALAIASKDLLQNLIAGFYLVLVQPFRLGDKVAVTCSLPAGPPPSSIGSSGASGPLGTAASAASAGLDAMQGWFEGICEKVDLRYTVLRDGRRRLMVPNTAFVSREFMVYDDGPVEPNKHVSSSSSDDAGVQPYNRFSEQRASSSAPRTTIREGHLTTELPPTMQPVFPGMVIPHPSYAQYAPQHYTSVHYQSMQQTQALQQQLGHYDQHRPQHHITLGLSAEHVSASVGAAGSQGQQGKQATSQQQQQQQQGDIDQQPSTGPSAGPPIAKGPPGYLPQGFAAGHYVGIPMYYGVPGMVGQWPPPTAVHSFDEQHAQLQPQEPQAAAHPAMADGSHIPSQQSETWCVTEHSNLWSKCSPRQHMPSRSQPVDLSSSSDSGHSSPDSNSGAFSGSPRPATATHMGCHSMPSSSFQQQQWQQHATVPFARSAGAILPLQQQVHSAAYYGMWGFAAAPVSPYWEGCPLQFLPQQAESAVVEPAVEHRPNYSTIGAIQPSQGSTAAGDAASTVADQPMPEPNLMPGGLADVGVIGLPITGLASAAVAVASTAASQLQQHSDFLLEHGEHIQVGIPGLELLHPVAIVWQGLSMTHMQ